MRLFSGFGIFYSDLPAIEGVFSKNNDIAGIIAANVNIFVGKELEYFHKHIVQKFEGALLSGS